MGRARLRKGVAAGNYTYGPAEFGVIAGNRTFRRPGSRPNRRWTPGAAPDPPGPHLDVVQRVSRCRPTARLATDRWGSGPTAARGGPHDGHGPATSAPPARSARPCSS